MLAVGSEARANALLELVRVLGGVELVTYDETRESAFVRKIDDRRAQFRLANGRNVRITAPADHWLAEYFVINSGVSGGFFLFEDKGGPLYFNFVDAGRQVEPSADDTAAFYAESAAEMEALGTAPFMQGIQTVTNVSASETAIFFCMERSDGTRFDGATRYRGRLAVTAISATPCDASAEELTRRLELAEDALN
ncbi:MAG: hypothetical protein ACFBSD_11720 [Paracoccaceae bacterium]